MEAGNEGVERIVEGLRPMRRQLSGAAESAHNGAHRRAVAVRIPSAAYRGGDSLAEITVGIYQYRGDGGSVVIGVNPVVMSKGFP